MWGGAIVSPLGRSPELPALCVSLSEGLRPEATKEAPQREQQRLPERKAVLKGSLVAFY